MKKGYRLKLETPDCDYHVHTPYCNHANGVMEMYVLRGISAGLKRLVFLEHMEEKIHWKKKTWLSDHDFDAFFKEGYRLKEKYRGEIEIALGTECGYNSHAIAPLQNRLKKWPFEEVGISCHFLKIPDESLHLNLFSRDEGDIKRSLAIGPEQLLTRYFESLIQAIETIPGDFLCHLDGALRHIPQLQLTPNHLQQLKKILTRLSEKDIGLEINSSGCRIRGEQFPATSILEMIRENNLKIRLRLGSDAHRPEDVGADFNVLKQRQL